MGEESKEVDCWVKATKGRNMTNKIDQTNKIGQSQVLIYQIKIKAIILGIQYCTVQPLSTKWMCVNC